MEYLIFTASQLGWQILPTILITTILTAFVTGFVLYRIYEYSLNRKEKFNNSERFRLEIIQMSADYVRAGISLPPKMDGAAIGAVLQTGIIMLVRQDPLAVRILLLQILHVLGNEEDIKDLLNSKESIRSS
ncbi:MAG: hypothetical protein AAFQ94_28890 [Bacteroidota bacterium]